jgi:aminopeptidase YwaD
MRRLIIVCLAAAVMLAASGVGHGSDDRQAGPSLPPSAERAYLALAPRVSSAAALDVVSFMDQYWRLAANPGYNASIDHLRERLLTAGFSASPGGRATVRVDEFPNQGRGWDYRVGTVAFAEAGDPPLLSRERDHVSLAINSFSTPEGGLRAPLVDVGKATEPDYAGKDVKGAVVLTDAPLARVWLDAVRRGAAGVISTDAPAYIRPADGTALSEEQQDVLQWASIPYDAAAKGFGFKASWRAADRMRQRLRQGPVVLRVEIDAAFYDGPNRTLVAEIQGRSRPAERIVMVAHVQEPGANDNGTGCGTLYALARALNEAIAAGALPPPERTLTFLWVDEIRGSREWMRAHPDDARGVQYMFALDMTGEDTRKTGGAFLIEKQADPSAVWPRPSDPHTEWGSGQVAPASLKGSLLNDLHLAVCLRRARDAHWTVRTNPYEGDSDHTVFADAGVPALLNWHFTDRYYHTNQDRLDKVSASEMQNVGIAVGASAWFLASADERDARTVATLIEGAASRRLALERAQSRGVVGLAADTAAAEVIEQQVIAAWIKWYGEALDSVLRLPPSAPTDALRGEIATAKERIR